MSSPARLVPLPKTTTQAAWIPTNRERYSTHQTAVAQEGPRGAQTQAAEDRRIAQRILPEEQPNKIGPPSCCTAPPQNFRRSTFSFSESRTAVFFSLKRKSGFGPRRASGKQSPAEWAKEKCFSPQEARPTHKEAQPGNIRPPLPKTTHPGGVDTNEQVTVFHPLNGSGAKGTTGRSNSRRRKQEGYPRIFIPEESHISIGFLSCCTAPLQYSHWSTFSFSKSRNAFYFESKEKGEAFFSKVGEEAVKRYMFDIWE